MNVNHQKILVTGATGFLGRRVCRLLEQRGCNYVRSSLRLGTDLRDESQTRELFAKVKPVYVLNCAAFVGGIQFGARHAAELFHNNLLISVNLLAAAHRAGIVRMVNPISNCAYPGSSTFFKEDEFWDGPLHESVMVYGTVRKAFWVGSWAYAEQYGMDVVNIILSNMYGPEDHFEAERSHALGALIMKFAEAKKSGASSVDVWGSGKPVREWLHVDDGAEAMVRSLDIPPHREPINIGVGKGISVLELARKISDAIGYTGDIKLDLGKADGAPCKTVDGSKGNKIFGWQPQRKLDEGIEQTVLWYSDNFTA